MENKFTHRCAGKQGQKRLSSRVRGCLLCSRSPGFTNPRFSARSNRQVLIPVITGLLN